jgi:dihydropyrimidine dehydrogenase (NAD+) subunit PreT
MTTLPAERTERKFREFKEPLNAHQAEVEAWRCLFCHEPPCAQGCPAHIDIPGFIRKIGTGNLWGSARTVFTSNILGMSCARVCPVEVLCTGRCVLVQAGFPPVQIGRLQRYVTDLAYSKGWRFFERAADTGLRVALIGAGPASLAAAHELSRLGHRCVIFEKNPFGGGLNAVGMAPYKLQADRALQEVSWVLGIGGIELRTGVEVGCDVAIEDLETTFDAVFVGFGLGADQMMSRLSGVTLPGVEGAVQFVKRMKTGTVSLEHVRHAVVIGGGNTAVDVTRELLALAVPSVTLMYRRGESSMKGYVHEWEVAKKNGARSAFFTAPVAFEGSDRLTGVRAIRLGPDLLPIDEEEFVLPADRAYLAIGQSTLGSLLAAQSGISIRDGRVIVDERGFTGRPGWYAGGDCANGGKEVVNAAVDGTAAAQAIHAYLLGRRGQARTSPQRPAGD